MKIEAGKRYTTRGGEITGPMETYDHPVRPFRCMIDGALATYYEDGTYARLPGAVSQYDLVAEYKGPKEREIVDWCWDADGEEHPVYADEDDAGADSLPLLNIFKPIRTIHSKTPAKFLARADDGSYLFEVGGLYSNIQRVDADDVDDQFENTPDETRAVVRLYKNAGGKKFFVWGSDSRSQSALATCELTYSDEEGWRVRDLKGEEK